MPMTDSELIAANGKKCRGVSVNYLLTHEWKSDEYTDEERSHFTMYVDGTLDVLTDMEKVTGEERVYDCHIAGVSVVPSTVEVIE